MTPDKTLTLAQWFSPSFPIGAFSFSHGLEWLIEQGELTTPEDLYDWVEAILMDGTGRNDMIFLQTAYDTTNATQLAALNDLCIGFCSAAGRVVETVEQGCAFSRTLRDMGQSDLLDYAYPVAVGRAARLKDLPLDTTIRFYLHAFAANLVSAAVRRVPLGQTDGQQVLSRLNGRITKMAAEAQALSTQDLSNLTFAADIAAMKHETLYSKTFRS